MTKFQRRHYQTVAETLRDLRPSFQPRHRGPETEQWNKTVLEFNAMFRRDNSRYQPSRFVTACGELIDDAV